MVSEHYDVVIVGGGPAGSTLAFQLAQSGRSALIVERAEFPREHIGESLTGECGRYLRTMGLGPSMDAMDYPVKNGVSVSGPGGKGSFFVPVQDRNAQGTLVPLTTWQVNRASFDQLLLDAATDLGADYVRAETHEVLRTNDTVNGAVLKLQDGTLKSVSCSVLADASGQSAFLSKKGIAGPRRAEKYDKQIVFYAQLTDFERDDAPNDGNTLLFYQKKHHWAWSIPISDTVTSVGVVLPAQTFKDAQSDPVDFFEDQLQSLHPDLAGRTSSATRISEVWRMSNYSYDIEKYTGDGFLCIGDAHRFLDPIFSFGVYIGMTEARVAATAIDETLKGENPFPSDPFRGFRETSARGQSIVQLIIDTFWEYPLAFLKLAHFTHTDEMAELFAGRIYHEDSHKMEIVRLMTGLAKA
jgi:flavin-dependent dehydrogenase